MKHAFLALALLAASPALAQQAADTVQSAYLHKQAFADVANIFFASIDQMALELQAARATLKQLDAEQDAEQDSAPE